MIVQSVLSFVKDIQLKRHFPTHLIDNNEYGSIGGELSYLCILHTTHVYTTGLPIQISSISQLFSTASSIRPPVNKLQRALKALGPKALQLAAWFIWVRFGQTGGFFAAYKIRREREIYSA